MSTVLSEKQEYENHLAEEHGLTKVTAYIRRDAENKRSSGAERVARHRQKKRAQGLVPVDVPEAIALEIKAAGSFDAWYQGYKPYREDTIKRVKRALQMAQQIDGLPRWLRKILGIDV